MTENHAVSSHAGDHGHGSVTSYIIGFILSVLFTVASFAIVITHSLSFSATTAALGVLAVLQIFVQVTFFLHVSAAPEKRSDLISFLFSIFVALVIVFGTLFVMHNVGHLMMAR
ncbi:cytochrome o ubiquinol oxidase subunit IV [Commensalibacter oyaizuii]|uniref:Cytochrome bo(3) ubiquinol oxidase subunit 4 n=1 Tax=Commensalibacter oyaizuii TaxID=3043873 RepID=A0ABT6PYV3_9PROT|nr:cytochrome o ubiquinol oxidase subunit IV [Commensalibacter sp. TBRC 16381]MDI2090037.1 cytochrome o ubiquinol oxidase subunit IV [Commensalibacter sp. TBRC 16381]